MNFKNFFLLGFIFVVSASQHIAAMQQQKQEPIIPIPIKITSHHSIFYEKILPRLKEIHYAIVQKKIKRKIPTIPEKNKFSLINELIHQAQTTRGQYGWAAKKIFLKAVEKGSLKAVTILLQQIIKNNVLTKSKKNAFFRGIRNNVKMLPLLYIYGENKKIASKIAYKFRSENKKEAKEIILRFKALSNFEQNVIKAAETETLDLIMEATVELGNYQGKDQTLNHIKDIAEIFLRKYCFPHKIRSVQLLYPNSNDYFL